MLRLFLIFMSICFVLPVSRLHADEDGVTARERSYIALDRVARESSGSDDRARLVSAAYSHGFGDVRAMDLGAVTLRDLRTMFMAAASADFYDTTDAHLSDMRRVLEELERRHEAAAGEVNAFYSALFQGRKFDEMASFYAGHPEAGLSTPIRFHDAATAGDRHTVLDFAASKNVVSLRKVDLHHGTHVLVIAHPLCHFSRNATAAIESQSALQQVFAKHSVWISPPDRNADLSPFYDWNKSHSDMPISIAYGRAGWPEVRIWQTPTFIFIKDGKVVSEVVGWPREGNMESLRRELSRLGLAPGNARQKATDLSGSR